MKEIGDVKFDKANDRQSLVELNVVQCVKERERSRESYEIYVEEYFTIIVPNKSLF